MNFFRYQKYYFSLLLKFHKLRPPFFLVKHNDPQYTNDACLLWHLELGDAIVCNGLVRILAPRYHKFHLPVRRHFEESISFMFSDIPNIELHLVDQKSDYADKFFLGLDMEWRGAKTIRISDNEETPDFISEKWDREFYRLAEVPYEERWNSFKLPPIKSDLQLPEKFIFVHDDPSRGWTINVKSDLPIVRPKNIGHAFLWLPAIQNAEEIHCIDSSFFHLVESVEIKTDKLFFHHIRTTGNKKWQEAHDFRKKWAFIRC